MGVLIFVQPYMSVDACALIKPAFVLCGICSYNNYIFSIIIYKIGNIIIYANVPAFIIAQVKTIYPNVGIPENSIKLNLKTLARIRSCNSKMFAVPANTCCRKQTSHWFVAMRFYIKIIYIIKR